MASHSDARIQDVALRGAVALSNAGASLLVSDCSSIETVVMPALTHAVSTLQQLCTLSIDSLFAGHLQLPHQPSSASWLEVIEAKVNETNRHLSLRHHPAPTTNCIDVPMGDLDCKSIRTLIEDSQANLSNIFNNENVIEIRPIRMTDCCLEQMTSTMRTDLVSAIMLYNYGLGFLMSGHFKINELNRQDVHQQAIKVSAKEMVQTSRQLFRLARDILSRYEDLFNQRSERIILNNSGDTDKIQLSAVVLVVWTSVLSCDYQAALIHFLFSEVAVAFEDDYFQSQGLSLQHLANRLLKTLNYIYGSYMQESGAPAA